MTSVNDYPTGTRSRRTSSLGIEPTGCVRAILCETHEMDEATLEMATEHGSKKRIGAVVEPTRIVTWDHTKLDVAY